MQTKTSKKAVL